MPSHVDLRHSVAEWIDAHVDEIIAFLKRIVQTPSPTGEEGEVQAIVSEKLGSLGMRVDVWEPDLEELRAHPAAVPVEQGYKDRPNVVGVWPGQGGGRSLLLNGHIDVVPPGPASLWRHDPWGATIEDGKMYGRGTTDMKGGVAAMICAVEALVELGVRLRGDVIVESVVDEEAGGNGTLSAILRGYKADAAVVTEPTQLGIYPAHRGAQFFRVRIFGKGAHAGLRFEGVSALEKAQLIIDGLRQLESERDRMAKQNPLYKDFPIACPITIGKMQAGVWPAMVAEQCEFEGMIDIMPGESIDEVRRQFLERIDQVAAADPWLRQHRPKVEWIGVSMIGTQIDMAHPFVEVISEKTVEVTGKAPVVMGFPAGSDLRLLTEVGGMPGVHLGPGDLRRAHGFNEYVDVAEVIDCTKILAQTMIDWCGVA